MSTRIDRRFEELKSQGRAALVTFLTAGDPDPETSLALLRAVPAAGADVVELGMPFTDPMADGPAIQLSSQRALKAGQTLKKTLEMVRAFRRADDATPLVLMGYYNPIYVYGVDRFLRDAKSAGVDGLIVVDLPPEEDEDLCLPALKAGVSFIRLATPTTDDKRLPAVLANTSGFVYYVSITGITGAATPDPTKAKIHKIIEPEEVFKKTGYSRLPHTVHCGPEGIYVSTLGGGGKNGTDGPPGIFIMDCERFDVLGRWEIDRGPQNLHYDFWWNLPRDYMVTSEWGQPPQFENGIVPEDLLANKYGHRVHF